MAILQIGSDSSPSVVGDGSTTTYSFKLSNVPVSILSVAWNGYNNAATVSSYSIQHDILTVVLSTALPSYTDYTSAWKINVSYLF